MVRDCKNDPRVITAAAVCRAYFNNVYGYFGLSKFVKKRRNPLYAFVTLGNYSSLKQAKICCSPVLPGVIKALQQSAPGFHN